jgi:hypothetical protein
LKFLGRARRFFQELASEPEAKVQYFNVVCALGHRVRGERTEGYQALRCPACGEGVFVLPRSPLPEPIAPARPQAAKAASVEPAWVEEGPVELTDPASVALDIGESEGRSGEAEIIWEEPPVEAPRRDRDVRGRVKRATSDDPMGESAEPSLREAANQAGAKRSPETPVRRRRKSSSEGRLESGSPASPSNQVDRRSAAQDDQQARPQRPATAALSSRGQPADVLARQQLEPRPAGRRPSLNRWILIVVPFLVVMAVGWRYWQGRRQEYPLDAEKGRLEGIPALEEGNFDRAYQLLSAAKIAVNALGGDVEGADKIREAADEADIFVHLTPQSLEDMLDEAGRTDPQAWAAKFDTHYKGQSILIDSSIAAQPGTEGSAVYEIWYKVVPPGGASNFNEAGEPRPPRIGWIDLTGFQLFEQVQPKVGDRVTFGARFLSFQYDDNKDIWVIRLEPKSGVSIQHTRALEALGWPSANRADTPKDGQP